MPFTLPALSRRQFLASSAAVTLSASALRANDAPTADPHRFALMADIHIPSSPDVEARGVNMHDHLVQASKEILALEHRPAAAMILGDCAYLVGKAEDYALLVKTIAPLRDGGLPVHLALGNHDHRGRFWKALHADESQDKTLEAKHVLVIKSPRANWFVLDSLDITDKAPGLLGEAQLAWLAKLLDAHADKPAIVCLHHQPDLRPMPGGLVDTQPLYDVILPRKQVKAMFFGHTHHWEIKEHEGLHQINLPPVAYVFAKGKPSGFVEVELAEDSALLRLHSLDKTHPEHGKETTLKWRS